MPALRELQCAVYHSLLAHDDAGVYIRTDGVDAAARLSIYRNTFIGTLTNALRLSYPAVHRLVGVEFFETSARMFIEGQPPRSAYLDEYGAAFPEFLARVPGARSVPYVAEVARLEWAVNRALHAPDATPLNVRALSAVQEAAHGRICFVPHPSISLIQASYPVDTIWRAVLEQDDAALGAADFGDAPIWLLIQQLATGIDVRRMDESAWRCTSALCTGQALQEVLELASDVDVSMVLAEHLAAGRFIAFRVTDLAAAQLSESVP